MVTENKIESMVASDLTNAMTDFSVAPETTDGAGDQKETRYQNRNWEKNLGYYKKIPELRIAIDTKANWVVGNGFTSDEVTTLLLGRIKGNGKDSFNTILENMERVCQIGEDAYSEIIKDKDVLINLKPLDTSSIISVTGRNGRILRYEQINKTEKPNKIFEPENIFVLSHNRIADEIHGISVIDSVEWIIKARNEAMQDYKKVMHRYVAPLFIFHIDSDDSAQIAAFKTKYDNARKDGENLYVPKGAVVPELVATAANATLNPLTWIENLNDYFFQAVGVPQIIVGNAKSFTDASGKIVYLAFEQRIKGRQLYVEEQVLNQLNLEIKLTFPASLQNEAISDTPSEKDMVEEEGQEPAAQPNDTTEELEGRA